MPHMKDLWVGMETHNKSEAGSSSSVFLSVITDDIQRLRQNFPKTLQKNRETAQANLYSLNVATKDIVTERFSNNSISVGIGGEDLWNPKHVVVWGRSDAGAVLPLGIATDISGKGFSTDESEGVPSLQISRVALGNGDMPINRLLMLMLTADAFEAETPNQLSIQITSRDRIVVDFDTTDTPQDDRGRSQANMYFVPVRSPFTRRSLSADSITLRILGDDQWKPSQFFLFGLDDAAGRPESLVPLVHIPSWGLGPLSQGAGEGKPRVTLPLV